MTPLQQQRYNRDLRIWEFRKKNPDMDLQDIAPIFNLSSVSISDALKRIDRHLNHGEPYVKAVDYSKRKRPTGIKYNKPERIADKLAKIAAALGTSRAAVLNMLISEWRGKK